MNIYINFNFIKEFVYFKNIIVVEKDMLFFKKIVLMLERKVNNV